MTGLSYRIEKDSVVIFKPEASRAAATEAVREGAEAATEPPTVPPSQ